MVLTCYIRDTSVKKNSTFLTFSTHSTYDQSSVHYVLKVYVVAEGKKPQSSLQADKQTNKPKHCWPTRWSGEKTHSFFLLCSLLISWRIYVTNWKLIVKKLLCNLQAIPLSLDVCSIIFCKLEIIISTVGKNHLQLIFAVIVSWKSICYVSWWHRYPLPYYQWLLHLKQIKCSFF